MTIWLINHYAVTPGHPGGTRHYDIGRALAAMGHDVTLVAAGFHYATFEETRSYPQGSDYLVEETDGMRMVWVKTKPYRGNGIGRVRNMLEFTRKLRALPGIGLPKPEVIVGSSVHLFAVYGAYRLAKKLRVPFVMEVRDIWPQTLVDMGVSKWHPFVLLLAVLEPFLYRRAEQIITLLPRAAEHIETFGIAPEKIHWISNGVDLGRFDGVTPSHLLEPGKFNVLYTGTMGTANNLEPLMEAANLLAAEPAIHITLVGGGPQKEALRKAAKNNVTVLDALPKQRVAPLLAEADVFFVALKNLPLYRFGMSMNKVFDYMAAKKPVVFAADVPQNPISQAGSGIVVTPDNPAAIANAVLKLYNCTEAARRQMGENGYRYVAEHFSMQIIAAQFENVLLKAIHDYSTN